MGIRIALDAADLLAGQTGAGPPPADVTGTGRTTTSRTIKIATYEMAVDKTGADGTDADVTEWPRRPCAGRSRTKRPRTGQTRS